MTAYVRFAAGEVKEIFRKIRGAEVCRKWLPAARSKQSAASTLSGAAKRGASVADDPVENA